MMGICQVFPIYPVSVEYLTVNGVIKKKLNITYTGKRLETVEKHIGQMPDFHWRDLGSSPGGIKFHGTIFLVLNYCFGEMHITGDASSGIFSSKSKQLKFFQN